MLCVIGIDPGLARSGLCLLDAGRRQALGMRCVSADTIPAMVDGLEEAIATMATGIPSGNLAAVALEDWTYRAPKATRGVVQHGLAMCRLIGRLEERLQHYPLVLVRAQDSKRDQPEGKLAKRLGIPGRNKEERSAYYAALWVAGTVRMAGGQR